MNTPIFLKLVTHIFVRFFYLAAIFLAGSSFAQAGFGAVTSVNQSGDTLTLSNGTDTMLVSVRGTQFFEVEVRPNGLAHAPTPMIDPNLSWSNIGATINSGGSPITMETSAMTIEINRSTGVISVKDSSGSVVFTNSDYSSTELFITHDSGIHFYGVQGGFHSWAGDQLSKTHLYRTEYTDITQGNYWNVKIQQGNAGGAFAWTPAGFGVLVDLKSYEFQPLNGTSSANYPSNNGFKFISSGDVVTPTWRWYGFVGEPKQIIKDMHKISGLPQMYPKWAFGFSHSKWWNVAQNPGIGSAPQTQMREWIDGYRSRGIPLDNFALDFDWKDWSPSGDEFEWNTTAFPKGPTGELKTEMDALGIKLTGIIKARIHTASANGQYATANNYWTGFGATSDYVSGGQARELDFSKPEVRDWFAQEQYATSFGDGIISWWQDEGDERFVNQFSIYYAQTSYDWQRANSNVRVHNLQRTYFIGAQRYGFGMWSGDIFARPQNGSANDWGPMARERMRMLASVNIGMPRWGMDAGSFAHTPTNEQYARWMQFAAFTPIMRSHASAWAGERYPWFFGSQAEELTKQAIRFRYELFPYVYASDYEYSQTGVGLIRPLIWYEPDNTSLSDYSDAWMFGDSLLVAPVVDAGQTSKPIYLPAGQKWYDWFKGTEYNGGQTINYSLNATTWEDIPLFVKEGGIVVTQDWMNYVGEKVVDKVYVSVFPSSQSSSFTFYDDDGDTYAYESNNYFKQTITQTGSIANVQIDISAKSGSFNSDLGHYIFKIHDTSNINDVSVGGSSISKVADYDAVIASNSQVWATGTDQYGDVVYVKVAAGQATTLFAQQSTDLTIITTSLPDTRPGSSYSETLSAINVNGNGNWSLQSGNLPAGLSLSGSGVISGTVSNSANAQDYTFTVRVQDNSMTDDQQLTITVNPNSLPTVSTTTLPSGTEGLAYSHTLLASGGDGSLAWSLSSGSLPLGVSLSSSGVLSGTPQVAGNYNFVVQVSDVDADTDTQALSILVEVAPDATLYVYEGFDGNATGWAEDWQHDDGGSAIGTGLGLTYGTLPQAGDGGSTAYLQADRLIQSPIDFTGSEIWISWLHRMEGGAGNSVFEVNRQIGGSPSTYVRLDTSGAGLSYRLGNSTVGSLAKDNTIFFVMRLKDDAGTVKASIWSHTDGTFPSSYSENAKDTEITLTNGDKTLHNIGLAAWSSPTFLMDEIRVGDSYAAVIGATGGNSGGMSYQVWVDTMLNAGNTSEKEADFDYDNDGYLNLMEYALGMQPNASDMNNAPSISQSGDLLELTFNRDSSKSDITVYVEQSMTLESNDWTVIAQSSAGAAFQAQNGASSSIITESNLGGTVYEMKIKSMDVIGGSTPVFLRLRVED